jgi:hypothetical protein
MLCHRHSRIIYSHGNINDHIDKPETYEWRVNGSSPLFVVFSEVAYMQIFVTGCDS